MGEVPIIIIMTRDLEGDSQLIVVLLVGLFLRPI